MFNGAFVCALWSHCKGLLQTPLHIAPSCPTNQGATRGLAQVSKLALPLQNMSLPLCYWGTGNCGYEIDDFPGMFEVEMKHCTWFAYRNWRVPIGFFKSCFNPKKTGRHGSSSAQADMIPMFALHRISISKYIFMAIWQCVKTLYPFCSHQNSWDLWMFIPVKMVFS